MPLRQRRRLLHLERADGTDGFQMRSGAYRSAGALSSLVAPLRDGCGVSKLRSRREESRIYRRKASFGTLHGIPCSSCQDGQPLSFSASSV
jgi:hypothetical protein